ncbi:MAG: hypothetical protein FGM46_04980 [Ferruginibacter sp.]|nr:hypothetical protein [Ferruginibacter sp.]
MGGVYQQDVRLKVRNQLACLFKKLSIIDCKIGIAHYKFESIHPFHDGNGRIERIINVLYLILNDML